MTGGISSGGILAQGDFVLGGFCLGGFCPFFFCPGGFCPGGFCPVTVSVQRVENRPVATYWHMCMYVMDSRWHHHQGCSHCPSGL